MKTKQAFYFQLNVMVSWCFFSENVVFLGVFLVKMWCLKACYVSHNCCVSSLTGCHLLYGF